MKLYYSLTDDAFISAPGVRQKLETLEGLKRGSQTLLEVQFLEGENAETPTTLAASSLLHFGLKLPGKYEGDWLVFVDDDEWTQPAGGGASPWYRATLNLNTTELNTAFLTPNANANDDLPTVTTMTVFSVREPANDNPRFANEMVCTVANSGDIGTEGIPAIDVSSITARIGALESDAVLTDGVSSVTQPTVLLDFGSCQVTADKIAISRTGGSDAVLQQGLGSGAELNELWTTNSADGANVLKLTNQHAAGFSALAFTDHNRQEKMAVGFGNTSALHGFAGWGYLEMSDADNGGSAPGFGIWQSTTYAGALAYEHHPRIGLLENGDLLILERSAPAGSPYGSSGVSLFYFDGQTPVITLGNQTTAGHGYGDFRAIDANHAMVLREAEANRNTYYSYGGTSFGVGHIFKTGGARGSQTIRMSIADDGVRIGPGVGASSAIKQIRHGAATLTAGTVTVSDTSVTANSRILLTVQSLGTVAAPKAVGVTARTASTSFTITSADATDTSVIAYCIIEP